MRQLRLRIVSTGILSSYEQSLLSRFRSKVSEFLIVVDEDEGPCDFSLCLVRRSEEPAPFVQLTVLAEGPRLEFTQGTLALGLDEMLHQLMCLSAFKSRSKWNPFQLQARMPVRGIRVGPDFWDSGGFRHCLEIFASLGVNTLAMDIVRLPITVESVEEETQTGEWLEDIRAKIDWVRDFEIQPILNFPIQLDLNPVERDNRDRPSTWFCRQKPSGRRQIIHRFENLIQVLPEIEGVGFVISDWGRCPCDLCESTSFEEEAAYYLRAFAAVLRRYRPHLPMWGFPDEISQHGFEEIRSQIPPGARIVAPRKEGSGNSTLTRQEFGEASEGEGSNDEEGEAYSLNPPLETELFRSDRVLDFQNRWDSIEAPHAFFCDLHGCSEVPLNSLSLLLLLWKGEYPTGDSENWIYQRMLPINESKDWKFWRETHSRLLKWVTGTADSSDPFSLPVFPVDGALANHHPSFNLIESLKRIGQRIQLDESLSSIMRELKSLPSGERIHGKIAHTLQGVSGRVYDLLYLQEKFKLETSERRCLESVRDTLNLLLSDDRNREVWDPGRLPSLTPLHVHRFLPSKEVP